MMINVPSTEARVLEFFGIKAEDLPVAVYADMSPEAGGMKKYVMRIDIFMFRGLFLC